MLADLLAQTTQPQGPLAKLADYSFGDYVFSVLGNLLSNAIVAVFIATGLFLLYLQKKFERLQADKDTHVAYAVAQHRRKEQTLTDFTDGIPQNLSMVYEIFTKRSFLRRMARVKPEERERYIDGRSYRQISLAYERDVRVWLTQCQHFTSLCTQVRSRFDSPEIHATVDRLREMFEALVELTPATIVVRTVSENVEEIATRGGFAEEIAGELAAIRESIDKVAAEPDKSVAMQFDRLASNRTARLIATHIDKLFIRCVDQMSSELRKLPVAGLKSESRTLKQMERGLRIDRAADQMATQQGASMHERKSNATSHSSPTLNTIAWLAGGLIAAGSVIGCHNYGGSVPIDDDAGAVGKRPAGSVDASVPIDDDAGMQKKSGSNP